MGKVKDMSEFVLAQAQALDVAPGGGIGVFDSGSGGMVTAGYVARMLDETGIDAATVFFGDTANLPYGTRAQENVAELSDAIIRHLGRTCPVIGIACNTASAAWARFGKAGKQDEDPRVFSVVQVAGEQAYARARIVPDVMFARGLNVKSIGVLGTVMTATIQSHAQTIVELFRAEASRAIGHDLPLIPYEFGPSGLQPTVVGVIDTDRTPHVGLLREDERAPGGTTRAGVLHWDMPSGLPQGVVVVSRDAQELVAAVDVEHVLDGQGLVKPEFRERIDGYIRQKVRIFDERKATALILGCTHFEYFERDFARVLPTIAAGGGIICPSGALAMRLFDAWRAGAATKLRPVSAVRGAYFGFSGDVPSEDVFRSLGLARATLVADLSRASAHNAVR
jgi:glutamate racemase